MAYRFDQRSVEALRHRRRYRRGPVVSGLTKSAAEVPDAIDRDPKKATAKGGEMVGQLKVAPGWILLTSGVGGPAAKWRDKALSRSILAFQCLQEDDWSAKFSHAELLTNDKGETFAARWRTRRRDNGLADYIGSNIMIVEPIGMTPVLFQKIWDMAEMDRFDGDVYPVWRLLLQVVSTLGPRFVGRFGFGSRGMCSEVAAKPFSMIEPYSFYARPWRGKTPAMLENWARTGRDFRIQFEGLLTDELMEKAGLKTFKELA